MGMFGPNIIETEMLNRADLVVLAGVDPMMSHTPWSNQLPTCELVLRPEYETLSPNPAARVDGDLRVALRRLAVPQPGFSEKEILLARTKFSSTSRDRAAHDWQPKISSKSRRRAACPKTASCSPRPAYPSACWSTSGRSPGREPILAPAAAGPWA